MKRARHQRLSNTWRLKARWSAFAGPSSSGVFGGPFQRGAVPSTRSAAAAASSRAKAVPARLAGGGGGRAARGDCEGRARERKRGAGEETGAVNLTCNRQPSQACQRAWWRGLVSRLSRRGWRPTVDGRGGRAKWVAGCSAAAIPTQLGRSRQLAASCGKCGPAAAQRSNRRLKA